MFEGVVFALIGGGFALAGSIITGLFIYRSTASIKETERYRKEN